MDPGRAAIFRYQRAALLIRAVEDFLDGPAIYSRNPGEVHASLEPIRRAHRTDSVRREQVMAQPVPPVGPRSRLSFLLGVLWALASEWVRPDSRQRAIRVDPRDHLWFRVRGADLVAVDEHWEIDQPLYHRSRAQFRTMFRHALHLLKRMRREMPGAVRAWHDAHPTFTSEAAWRAYLGLPAHSPAPVAGDDAKAKVMEQAG
jgi:galactofuranosylgalactofuranosylrhamnosyl-N-acetylglucosaminyl-diphospho-decaprenol beta-1,5/1,6-galactofuranosyltransferase